ncbi:MAG: hypothetical protein JRI80_00005 [Deltaproteobacteria bacterium]|nr:hypothetical protein [Deltaproteobacteria bacterium]
MDDRPLIDVIHEQIYRAIENAHYKGLLKGQLAHLQATGKLAANIAAKEINKILKQQKPSNNIKQPKLTQENKSK